MEEYWVLDPDHLAHRFYRREGELLAEFTSGADRSQAHTVPGFWLKRAWLDPEHLPEVAACLKEIYSG